MPPKCTMKGHTKRRTTTALVKWMKGVEYVSGALSKINKKVCNRRHAYHYSLTCMASVAQAPGMSREP